MHEATRVAARTIAVLSPAFLESEFCEAEWAAAFRKDPTGRERRLVPVRVRMCEPAGLLGSVTYVDVVGRSQEAARETLLAGVCAVRGKPAVAPGFPAVDAREQVLRPDTGAAIFNVPVTTRTFIGRARPLEELAQGLLGEGVVAITQIHAIHGLGGVGKTQLAARYARTHRRAYDVIWWLRAEQPATLRADLAGLAFALGVVDVGADDDEAPAASRHWLERNSRWLLVFDNATAPEAIAELVPEGEGGHVLITSRAHADWRALHAEPLQLDVWERGESLDFLTDRTGEDDRGVMEAVADALGDLPLALEQAAAYRNKQAITLAVYADRLRDRAPELFAAGKPPGYQHTVATVWAMAFEQVANDEVAADLLGMCACMAPERIPRELLDAFADHFRTPGVTAREVGEATELLLGYALLTPAGEQTVDMHRLVGQLARDGAAAGERRRAAGNAVTLLSRVLPEQPSEHQEWPTCQRLLAHALTAAYHSDELHVAPEETALVLVRTAQYQQEHPDVAMTLKILGTVHESLAAFAEARVSHQRALTIEESVYGLTHPEVACTLGNLSNIQQLLGEFDAARTSLQRALAIFEAVYGPSDPEVAKALGNLGALEEQLGEFKAARKHQERALSIDEAVFGPDHPSVATALTNLGILQSRTGARAAARRSLQRALSIDEAVYGPEHPSVATTLTNLGAVQSEMGDLPAARMSLQRALSIEEAVHGPEHPSVATTLANLGVVQSEMGELTAGRESAQRALLIFERSLGSDHPTTQQVREILASIGVSRSRRGTASGPLPTPHSSADPRSAAALNRRYLDDMRIWEALPRLKRLRSPKPKRPTGI